MFRKFSAALFVAAAVVPATASSAAPVVDRDEFSTTTRLPDGTLKTSLSSEPQNFRSGEGWKAVNTKLEEKADGALGAVAVDGTVVIPEALGAPVELGHRGNEVTFRLIGASGGDADVEGSAATFADALNGVDARYAATATGVKETLVLATAASPNIFKYDVRADPSWTASLDQGAVVLGDNAGRQRYRIDAPLAWDSAADPSFTNDLALTVEKVAAGRWTVTLRPNAEWLDDEDRVYPVSIDPDFSWSNGTTNFHGAIDTYLASGDQANSVFSASSYMQTGHYNRVYKSLLKFDIAAAIPANATVSSATFKAYAPPATPKSIASHSLRTVTSDWDANANWNRRKVGVSWGTSGGDVSSSSAHTSAAVNVQVNPGWYSWTAPLATVQGWVSGSLPNYGFQLATDAGAPSGNSYVWASTQASMSSSFPADSTKWPTLDVTWTAGGDTSPPPVPTDIHFADFDALTRVAELEFTANEDVAPTGVTPSGIDEIEVRVAKNGGAYTGWSPTTDETFLVTEVDQGDVVGVQLRARDQAGNVSSIVSQTFESFYDEAGGNVEAAEDFSADFGIPLAVAESWMLTQDKARDALMSLQNTATSYDIADLWFDNTGLKAHVQMTSLDSANEVEEAFQSEGIAADLVIDEVDYQNWELETAQHEIYEDLPDLVAAKQILIFLKWDRSGLRVIIPSSASASDKARVGTAIAAAGVPAVTIERSVVPVLETDDDAAKCTRTVGAPESELFDDSNLLFNDCGPELRGGGRISFLDEEENKRYSCTAGTPALSMGGTTAYLMTAGHCLLDAETGSGVAVNQQEWDFRPSTALGKGHSAVDEGNLDVGLIKLTELDDDERLTAQTYWTKARQYRRIRGVADITDPYVKQFEHARGTQLCVVGAVTRRKCSPVLDVYQTTPGSLQDSEDQPHAIALNSCKGREGDSGSPVLTKGLRLAGINYGHIYESQDSRNEVLFDDLVANMPPGFVFAKCPDHTSQNRSYGLTMATPIVEAAKALNVRPLGGSAVKLGDQFAFDPGVVRVSAEPVYPNANNVSLMVWDTAGNSASSATGTNTIPDTKLEVFPAAPGSAPNVEFIETANRGRTYMVGLCYTGAPGATNGYRVTLLDQEAQIREVSPMLSSSGPAALAITPVWATWSGVRPPSTGWCGDSNVLPEPPACGNMQVWNWAEFKCLDIIFG